MPQADSRRIGKNTIRYGPPRLADAPLGTISRDKIKAATGGRLLRAGCALALFMGVLWFAAARQKYQSQTNSAHPLSHSAAFVAVDGKDPSSPNFQYPFLSAALAADTINFATLQRVQVLLAEQRRLNPIERGREDEIRCALLALLTDENAAELVQTLPSEWLPTEFGVAALARWASADTLSAVLWLARQPVQTAEQTHALARALSHDPALLETLCAQLPASAWRETLLENSCRATLPENPPGAIWLAQHLQPGPSRTKTLLMIADDWTARNPAATARWIATESDPLLRDELIVAGSTALASTDPMNAFVWATSITSPAAFERTIDRISTLWTSYAPEQSRQFSLMLAKPRPGESDQNFLR